MCQPRGDTCALPAAAHTLNCCEGYMRDSAAQNFITQSPKPRWSGLHSTGKFDFHAGFGSAWGERAGLCCAGALLKVGSTEDYQVVLCRQSLSVSRYMAIWVVLFCDQTVIQGSGLWVWHGQVLSSIYSAQPWLLCRSSPPPPPQSWCQCGLQGDFFLRGGGGF